MRPTARDMVARRDPRPSTSVDLGPPPSSPQRHRQSCSSGPGVTTGWRRPVARRGACRLVPLWCSARSQPCAHMLGTWHSTTRPREGTRDAASGLEDPGPVGAGPVRGRRRRGDRDGVRGDPRGDPLRPAAAGARPAPGGLARRPGLSPGAADRGGPGRECGAGPGRDRRGAGRGLPARPGRGGGDLPGGAGVADRDAAGPGRAGRGALRRAPAPGSRSATGRCSGCRGSSR